MQRLLGEVASALPSRFREALGQDPRRNHQPPPPLSISAAAGEYQWEKHGQNTMGRTIANELSRYGRLVSPIKRIPLGYADIKCFKCGRTGHLVRACPERQSDPGVSERLGQEAAEPAVVVPSAATVRPAAESPGVAAAPEQTESEPQVQPAVQKPTGTTITPEELCAAEPVTVKSCSAELVSVRHGDTDRDQEKPCLTEPDLGRPCSVDSGAVLELPVLAEAGTEVQSCRLEAPVTTPVQEDGGDVEMEDEPTFKVPTKRKKKGGAGPLSLYKCDRDGRSFQVLLQFRAKEWTEKIYTCCANRIGDLLSEPTEIRKQTVHFYLKLYSSERSGAQIVEESFLKDLPKLTEQAARELDRELTLAELHKALQGMENGRAPGIDGLPFEFYKAFWAVIEQDVLEVLRDSMNAGQLPLSCRRAVLTVLPKKGDLTHLKNWRPVSLLCTDIKLLSKALASRLTKVLSAAKVNWVKSEAILVGEWGGERPTLPGGLVWKKDGFKYLGVYLGNNEFLNKNWEGSVEHVKGRLSRWKRLVPKMSFRGRTLVINNLAASSLWHKLACVDPPPNLLASIQALLVDFFWDGLHWIPQSVVHLPKEEGGQGLVQLASRTAAFHLQFLQRLLTGPKDLIWRPVAHGLLHKVRGLGLDRTLKQNKGCGTLHWLLEKPLIHGGRLDISGVTAPALSRAFISSRVVTLRELVNIAGTDLSRAEDLVVRLGLRSLRVVNQLLHRWRTVLTSEERVQLMDYQITETNPAEEGSFPQLDIAPHLDGSEGPLLECWGVREMDFGAVSGKLLYRVCVKVLNKKKLSGRVDTPWRSVLGFNDDVKPEWTHCINHR
ncbi:hypothetical protein QTP70_012371 [Hemibagrus guttatus]|uniref:CCHC-type domain-containing protein n=1 Tax=Hemibagrus guttatus TaxID=175788 RepID=A0AAE0Q3G5_9TELE|nr:hypothetical protein QTP70_012371 [Hemibagrus guttatus]